MDDELERTAYHESGHAYMAHFLGGRVERITLEPEDDDGPQRYGDARISWNHGQVNTREQNIREIKVCLAGPAAEIIYSGEKYDPQFLREWSLDFESAIQFAMRCVKRREHVRPYLDEMIRRLIEFFDQDQVWAGVAALADELLAHETLSSEEVCYVLQNWMA